MECEKKSRGLNLKAAMMGAVVGIIVTCLLWFTCAILLFTGAIAPSMLAVCSYASLGVGAIVGAFFASMSGGVRMLNSGVVASIMMFFFSLLGFFLKNTSFSAISFVIVLIILLISAIIGSMISTLFK